jgi:hypothetical protein
LAKQLPRMASDPAAVRATLANPPAPLIPGDNPAGTNQPAFWYA